MTSLNAHTFARIRRIYENRSDPEYARAFAELYWRALLLMALIVTIAICAYSGTIFFGIISDLTPAVAPSSPASSASSGLDRNLLDSTLAGFSARQAQFQALQTNPIPSIVDPSQ